MSARTYYNEFDPKAAAWLRQLIAEGHIAPGDVDERSIAEVQPADLVGYTQCHFFAGIGGWSLALRLAGWPDDRPVWTGSCPCQPFSAAGKGEGFTDPRHLWPEFFRLIRESRPVAVFGEQVSGALAWLDLVSGDLEGEGYACGSVIVGAHSVGAPHIRQRLYWVADTERGATERHRLDVGAAPSLAQGETPKRQRVRDDGRDGGPVDGLADASSARLPEQRSERGDAPETSRSDQGQAALGGDTSTPWSDLEWLLCRDGKTRPTQPGLFPLAYGVPGRVGLLRGYGNAIVPACAVAFIEAYRDVMA